MDVTAIKKAVIYLAFANFLLWTIVVVNRRFNGLKVKMQTNFYRIKRKNYFLLELSDP